MVIIVILLFCLVLALAALGFALNSLTSLFRDKVPYVSTPDWAIDWLQDNLKLPDGAVVYDLGCGDARVLIELKNKFPQIRAIGYELQWWPYLLARWKSRGSGVTIKRESFYHADLSDATIVFCFLITSVMTKVEAMLKQKLKPGTTVYSYGFTFPTWEPVERITNPARPQGSKINIYRV